MPFHLNLTVADIDRSVAFYRRWLGFGDVDRAFPDGTVFVRDDEGTDLAFHEGASTPDARRAFHFGFRWAAPESIRRLEGELRAAGVPLTEFDDDPDVVSVKFTDPDGYLVEIYWESPKAGR